MMAAIDPRQARLILDLRQRGFTQTHILDALERTPRNLFIPEHMRDRAFEDAALPIDCGQTISQPAVVAWMTTLLEIKPHMTGKARVLEIGTGSGYQTAVLAKLCARVYTIERYKTLLDTARDRFARLGLNTIETLHGDGHHGWPDHAPFDAILVTAAARIRPDALIAQARIGAPVIVPVGKGEAQRLMRYRPVARGLEETDLGPIRFVPLVEGLPETRTDTARDPGQECPT